MASLTVLNYELLEKLGSGGMGEVFRAHDKRLNRYVAIKVLTPGKSGEPERRRRFIQEAQAASALNHPNIITIHDILQESDKQYIVMEYVSGRTLLDLIPSGGLPVSQVLQYATQMADALSIAHSAGIIHRDFKPANVMVTSSGLIKILDFGLAKLTDRSASAAAGASNNGMPGYLADANTLTSAPLTVEGSIMGTVNYMSPEQAEGKKVDARSDVFSFGAVLYEMATGRRAFQGDSDISTLSAVLRDEVKPISQICPDAPHELDEIIAGCLRKNPDVRWQSMREVEMALHSLKRRSDSGVLKKEHVEALSRLTQPGPKKPLNRNTLILGGAALAVLLLAGAGVWWWVAHRHTEPQSVAQVSTPPPSVSAPTATTPTETTPATPEVTQAPVPVASPANAGAKTAAPSIVKAPVTPPRDSSTTTVPPAVKPSTPPASRPATKEAEASKVEATRATPEVAVLTLSDALPFRIALTDDVPADAPEGQVLNFTVIDDVKVDGIVVIHRGAAATGSVVGEAGKKKFFSTSKVTYQLVAADGVGGAKIHIRATAARKADGPISRPLDTGKYAKAKELAAARGTDYIAYVDGQQTVQVSK